MATAETNQQERTEAQDSDAQGTEEATGQQQEDGRQGDGAGTQEIRDNFPVRKNARGAKPRGIGARPGRGDGAGAGE